MDLKGTKQIIIDNSPDVIRAICGLEELLKQPSFEAPARVGRRRNTTPKDASMNVDGAGPSAPKRSKLPTYVAGKELDEAEAAGEALEILWPFRGAGAWSNWKAIETLWKSTLSSISAYQRRSNTSPVLFTHPSSLSNAQIELLTQTVFERLNLPAASLLSRSVASVFAVGTTTGLIVDVGYASSTVTPVIDTIVADHAVKSVAIGIAHCEMYMSRLLSADAGVLEALSQPPPVEEGSTAPPTPAPTPAELPAMLLRLARHLWMSNLVRPLLLGGQMLSLEAEEEGLQDIGAALAAGKERALIEAKSAKSHRSAAKEAEVQKKKAAAAAAEGEAAEADVALVEFEGREFYVGRVRNRFCEPLFEPEVLQSVAGIPKERIQGIPSLQQAVADSVNLVYGPEKLQLWEAVIVVGELAKIKSLPASLLSHLMPYILTDPEAINDYQPKNTRFLKIPKYFPEYMGEGGYVAPFLGACVAAKLIFSDSSGKYFYTKVDYNHQGPVGMSAVGSDKKED